MRRRSDRATVGAMATTRQAAPPAELHGAGIMHVTRQPHVKREGAGWLATVAVLLVMSSAFMALLGILALADDAYWGGDTLVSGHNHVLFGWLYLATVPVMLTAALLIAVDHPFGAVMGIFIACCAGFLHLILIRHHPVGMGIFLAVDVLVVVVLVRYGFGAVKVIQPGSEA